MWNFVETPTLGVIERNKTPCKDLEQSDLFGIRMS